MSVNPDAGQSVISQNDLTAHVIYGGLGELGRMLDEELTIPNLYMLPKTERDVSCHSLFLVERGDIQLVVVYKNWNWFLTL